VINGNVTKVTPQILFRARLQAGDAAASAAQKCAEAAGVRILLSTYSADQVKFNESQAPSTIEACVRQSGERVATAAMTVIVRASNGQRGALRSGAIAGICDMFRDNPLWLSRIDQIVAALADKGLVALVTESMAKDMNDTGARGTMRKVLAGKVTKLLEKRLGAGKTRAPMKGTRETVAPKRVMVEAEKPDGRTRSSSPRGHDFAVQRPKAIVKGDEKAAIAEFIAKNGVRKVEQSATGDRYHLVVWLNRRGVKIEFIGRAHGEQIWRLDGRKIKPQEFDRIVDEERAKDGLQPLQRSAA
jgi:hypothetical protein